MEADFSLILRRSDFADKRRRCSSPWTLATGPSASAWSAVGRQKVALPNQSADVVSAGGHGEEEAFSLRFGPVRKLTLSAGLLLHFTSGAFKGHARSAASAMSRQLDRQASA
jgi:hypothetical protein